MNPPGQPRAASCSSRLALIAALLALGACAPDAWRPDAPYEAFLDQVEKNCGNERIGTRRIAADLLQDAYFLDLSSRFYHGGISRSDYASALAGSFGGAADAAGILCLLDLLPMRKESP